MGHSTYVEMQVSPVTITFFDEMTVLLKKNGKFY